MNDNEKLLITRTHQGDIHSFEKLIKPYESRIFDFLVKMCRERSIAEDLMQETFINAFRKLDTFRQEAKFSTWLFQIATNNCLMQKRKNSKVKLQSLDQPLAGGEGDFLLDPVDLTNNPADLYEQNELKEILDEALAQIPEIYRAVFILKDIEGFKAKEIAEMLKISLPNVKARVLRGRIMLQKILQKHLYIKENTSMGRSA